MESTLNDERRKSIVVPASPLIPVPPSPMSARAREAASALVSLTGLNFVSHGLDDISWMECFPIPVLALQATN